ncbi:MAG: NUDIX hydrolase [Ruminococcaceae bacterium]|nr:NUDIX hydrolase [Oscillospiraceae bacterium]
MRDEEMIEKRVSSETLYEGKILTVKRDTVELPSGRQSFREYAEHGGAVAVLPLTSEGEVVLVKQYRYAVGRVFLEVPAGKLDSRDEPPHEAAIRELREETGARCERLTPLGTLIPSPAILTERIHMYLAEGLSFGESDPDEDELLGIVRMPLQSLVSMIMRGEIEDAKTQIMALKVASMKL